MVEQASEEELTGHLAARAHERTAERRGYRDGHDRRRLLTHHGDIPDLAVPRAEEGGVEFQTLGRYQRRQMEIDKILGQLFLARISTRRLWQLSEALYGRPVSATSILQTTARLTEELKQYRTATIVDEEVEFLFLGDHRTGAGTRRGALPAGGGSALQARACRRSASVALPSAAGALRVLRLAQQLPLPEGVPLRGAAHLVPCTATPEPTLFRLGRLRVLAQALSPTYASARSLVPGVRSLWVSSASLYLRPAPLTRAVRPPSLSRYCPPRSAL